MLTFFDYPVLSVVAVDEPPVIHLAVFEHSLNDIGRMVIHG
jgi:hypothetical protein